MMECVEEGIYMYVCIHVHALSRVYIECRGFEFHPRQLIFLRKSDCLGCVVLLCLVCLFDLICFFHLSLNMHICT